METARIDEWLRHRDWIAKLARSLVSDPASADDLVQETWMVASRRPPKTGELARPWLLRVLRNLATQRHRSESSRRNREERTSRLDESPSAVDLVAKVEIQRLLAEAVLRLEEPFRETVVLRYFEDLTSAEIARRLRAPESTIRWRLMRALEMLRNDLDSRHDGSRERWISALAPLALPRAPIGSSAPPPYPSPNVLTGGVLVAKSSWKMAAALLLLIVLGAIGFRIGSVLRARIGTGGASLDPTSGEIAGGEPARVANMESVGGLADPRSSIALAPTPTAERVLVGRVLDSSRRAISGALVRASNWNPASRTSTEVDGCFRLAIRPAQDPKLPEDPDWVRLEITSDGRESKALGLRAPEARATHLGDLILRAGGSIRGKVVDETGAALVGSKVFVEDLSPVVLSRVWGGDLAAASVLPSTRLQHATRTSTRTDGSFVFEGLPPAPVRLWALDPQSLAAFSEVLWVKEGEPVECPDLVVRRPDPASVIRGVVVGADGSPVDGAVINAHSQLGGYARADDEGRFTAILMSPNPGMIDARPRNLLVSDPKKRWRDASIPDVAPGGNETRVVLEDWTRLTLRVRDPEGRPIQRCGANLTEKGSDLESYGTTERPGGEIALRVPSRMFGIIAYAPGYATRTIEGLDPRTLPASIDCTLERRPGVRGRVLADGSPVAGARVSMSSMLAGDSWRIIRAVDAAPRAMLSKVLGIHPLEETRTDAEGRFYVGLIADRAGLLRVGHEGHAPWMRWSVSEPIEDLVVNLGAGGSLEGTVAVREGSDPSGILVGATCGDEHVLATRTDPSGGYRFDRLTPGAWQVRLLAREQTPEELGVTVLDWGDAPKDSSPDCEVIEGRISRFDFGRDSLDRPRLLGSLSWNGSPAVGWFARLCLGADPREQGSSAVSPDGTFEITVATPGRYRLVLHSVPGESNPLSVHDEIDLPPGAKTWTFDLVTGRLSGRKLTALSDGGFYLYLVRTGPGRIACAALLDLSQDLRWPLSNVPAGAAAIVELNADRYRDPGSAPVLLPVDVPPGASIEVTVP